MHPEHALGAAKGGNDMAWMVYAAGSAIFAGLTAVLAKCGIRKTDSYVATAIRTVVVLIFAWLLVFLQGTAGQLEDISGRTYVFLALSGLATGASWLCYFRALQLGDVNKVVPVDKSSAVLTILLATVLFHESVSMLKGIGIVLIALGTFLMIQKKASGAAFQEKGRGWLFYAVLSAVFASLTAILGKVGISGVDSNLGTAIRTVVVLFMAWAILPAAGKTKELKGISKKELFFICLSGITTGASWLCYYRALKDGVVGVVVSVDKLSILVSILFSWLVFKEKLTGKAAVGLAMLTAGTWMLAIG